MSEVKEEQETKVCSPSREGEANANANASSRTGGTASKVDNVDYQLGGRSKEPCYCLLDGVFEDPESGVKSRITVPITKLPATIGRSHDKDKDDPHFFGLGSKKALSRKHCRISYRDAQGGKVEWDTAKKALSYKEQSGDGNEGHAALNVEDGDLPSRGFFVIECLGKNRILVNQGRVEQGNAAVLASGSSIRVSSYTLYFLRPMDSKPVEHVVTSSPPTSAKKRKIPDSEPSSSTPGNKRSKAQQDELDSLPVESLLEKMTEAIDNNQWERRHQLIGATIALHAVRESALDPSIQSIALGGGVSRSDVMVWIEESPKFSNWVQQMLSKMEQRSYQAAITKCLLKAGYTRTGSSGRYIKWYLPKDTPISPEVAKKAGNKKGSQSKLKDDKGQAEEPKDKDDVGDEEVGDDDDDSKAETGEGEEHEEDAEEKSDGDGADDDEEDVEEEDRDDEEDEDGEEDNSDSGSEQKEKAPSAADMDINDDSNDDEI